MTNPDDPRDHFTPITRLELKRVEVAELVKEDRVLSGCSLLQSLGDEDRARLLALAIGRRFSDGKAIYQTGDAGDSLFLVLQGDVRLQELKGSDRVELGLVHRGDFFGEAEVLGTTGARGGGAVAVGEVAVVELSKKLLQDLARKNPRLMSLLADVRDGRKSKGDEMEDFLKRW